MILRLASFLVATLILVAGFAAEVGAAGGPKDIVLVLDNSGSMKKNDPEFLTGTAVREFLDRLEGDNRVAVLLFDQTARLVMPLTPLNESTRPDFLLSLDKVDYKGLLTKSPAAIERAIYELKVNGRPGADKSIVFMTDGIVDTGDKAMDVEKSRWMREELSGDAADEKIRIFGIAFTENADFLLIQSLSKKTSGEYFRAYSASDIASVFRRVINVLDKSQPAAVVSSTPQIGLPEPVVTLPESSGLPETGAGSALPTVPETSLLTTTEGASSETLSTIPSLPEVSTPESAGSGALPTLSLPQLDSTPAETQASSGTQAATTEPAESAPADTTATTSPATESVTEPPPAPVPAPAPASQLPLPLPILIAIGAAVLVLLIAVVFLTKRKSKKGEPAEEQIPKAFLNDLGGVSQQQSYELNDKLSVVGRLAGSDADAVNYIVIAEPTIGRRHAMIEFKDHSFWVIDQSSLNGTYVNNKRIEAETRLKHGDRLRFHKHEFEFLILDMFETDRTMMSNTMFADMSSEIEDQDVTRARPNVAAEPEEDAEKTTANPGVK